MQPGRAGPASSFRPPTFQVFPRQPIRPAAVLLALLAFAGAFSAVGYGLSHGKRHHHADDATFNGTSTSSAADDDKDDDPSQVDVVYLGDPTDAPTSAAPRRPGHHAGSVHPTILIRLPHSGTQQGLIPDNPAGQLLYRWLAAFNAGSPDALAQAVPTDAPGSTVAALMTLRRQTGGLRLLSAKELTPGLLVFRLQDQTPAAGEVLGTLQLRATSTLPALQSFSLRTAPAPPDPTPAR